MQRSKGKNANPKKGETRRFSRCPNPGFGFGKMSGLPGYPVFKTRVSILSLSATAGLSCCFNSSMILLNCKTQNYTVYSGYTIYRVGQIKWHHFTFLLLTHECIHKILWFLPHVNYNNAENEMMFSYVIMSTLIRQRALQTWVLSICI